MQNVVLVVHLILALCLIAIVLFQRSEGGGLGIGGGNPMAGRAQANPLSKVTWALAVAFLITSMFLTILAARLAESDSVLERLGGSVPVESESGQDSPLGDDLLPPVLGDSPATPPKQE